MLDQMVVDKLRARYNTSYRNSSLQSEVDSLSFHDFMVHHQIQHEKECLRRIIEYLNNITPQIVDDFQTESNKIRYLRDAGLGEKWVVTLNSISTAQCNFDQLVLALNEGIQLEHEIEKASASSKT